MDVSEPVRKGKEKKGHSHKKDKDTKSSKKRSTKEPGAAPKSVAGSGSVVAHPDEDERVNKLRVEALCATPPNNICADCREHGTRWACVNHGVFVCLRCSGIHRSLGVHVSKVKSTNMDGWSTAEVDVMDAVGNARAASLFEAHVPATFAGISARSTDEELRTFIEKKYSQKAFAVGHVGDILRRIYKKAGYGPYAGRASKKKETAAAEGEAAADEAAAVKHADPQDTLRALYGRDTVAKEAKAKKSEAKKSKKEIPVYGTFGLVNVPNDGYAEHLAKLLELFGVPSGEEAAPPTGDGEAADESAPAPAVEAQEEEEKETVEDVAAPTTA